jgi:hypothetical protein
MKALNRRIAVGLLAAALVEAVLAQGINNASPPGVYLVISIDPDNRTVHMRSMDGRTGYVHVPEDVYDLSKLKPGAKIRVDFVAPDGKKSDKVSAAAVWPVD